MMTGSVILLRNMLCIGICFFVKLSFLAHLDEGSKCAWEQDNQSQNCCKHWELKVSRIELRHIIAQTHLKSKT